VWIAASRAGLHRVELADDLPSLTARVSALGAALELGRTSQELHHWLDETCRYLRDPSSTSLDRPPIALAGTPFQQAVWEALRTIPAGESISYKDIAHRIGRERATRAVAQACAANRIALWVPCHRVVPARGGIGGYSWGAARKEALLVAERLAITRPTGPQNDAR